MPVFSAVGHFANIAPERIAIQIGSKKQTYRELWQNAQQCHLALFNLSKDHIRRFEIPEEGALVVLAMPNHMQFAEIFVAASASPHCVAVLSPLTPDGQVEEILTRLQPDAVFTDSATSNIARIAIKLGLHTLAMEAQENGHNSYQCWLQAHKDKPAHTFVDKPESPFLIGFTSGTTGLPKAFIRTRKSWRKSLQGGRQVFALKSAETTLAPGPIAHGVTLYALAEMLECGGTLLSMAEFNPKTVLKLLPQADRFVGVPTMISALGKAAKDRAIAFPKLRQLVTGAAKLDRQHFELAKCFFPKANILQYYGASELSFVAVNEMSVAPFEKSDLMSQVGKAFPGVHVTIRNEEGALTPLQSIGTIFVESDLIASGYLWGDNGQSFKITPYGATVGDMGMLDQHGNLHVLGRAGNMIISAGNNIYLAEIEDVLKKITGISEAVAFGREDSYFGQRLVCVISLSEGVHLKGLDLKKACLQALPKFKVPKEFYSISTWPMTWSGKISRDKVVKMLEHDKSELIRL